MLQSVATDITSITATAAETIVAPVAGAAIAGTAGMTAAAATAVVGAGIGLVAVAIIAYLNRRGPKQKLATSAQANEVEPLLARNVEEYLAGPRTPESRAVALKNFDDVWTWLSGPNACGNPQMGEPGRRCIQERGRTGRPSWGKNWFELYRDPIEQDQPATGQTLNATASQLMAAITGANGLGNNALLFIGLGLLAAAVVLE